MREDQVTEFREVRRPNNSMQGRPLHAEPLEAEATETFSILACRLFENPAVEVRGMVPAVLISLALTCGGDPIPPSDAAMKAADYSKA